MALSVGTFNGGLNLLLLLVHLALALLAERTYALAARAQLHLTRATSATDVSQLHVSHWGSAGVKWLRQRFWEGRRGGGEEGKLGEDGGRADKDADDALSVAGNDGGGGGHGTGGGGGGGGSGERGKRANWDMPGGGSETKAEPDGSYRPRCDSGTADGSGSLHVGHGGSWSWAWVVALAAGLVALFPAELVLETGLDARQDCTPKRVVVTDGVCASQTLNVPDAAASVAVVLAAHLDWVDKTWTVVPEGASKSMVTAEVRINAAAAGRVVAANCALTTTPCTDVAGGCGNVVVQNTGGARGFVTVDSSLRRRTQPSSLAASATATAAPPGRGSLTQRAQVPDTLRTGLPAEAVTGIASNTAAAATGMGGRDGADTPSAASGVTPTTGGDSANGAPSSSGLPSDGAATGGGSPSRGTATGGSGLSLDAPVRHGDLVYTSSYLFWPETPSAADAAEASTAVTARGGHPRKRIAARGIEAVLTLADFGRIMRAGHGSSVPLTFSVRPEYGRVYNISCDTDGLHGGDLAAAASIFRTMQMSHPTGYSGAHDSTSTERALPPPLTVDGVLRGAFAWKSVDTFSSCSAPVAVYTECGVMDWYRAVPLVAVVATLLCLHAVAVVAAWDVPRELYVPTNAAAWQRLAMTAVGVDCGGAVGGDGGDDGGGGGGGDGGGPWGGCPLCLTGGTEVDPLSTTTSTTGGGGGAGHVGVGGAGHVGVGGTAVVPPLLSVPASPRASPLGTERRGGRLPLPLPGSPVARQTPHGSVYMVLGDA
ncbi:hypothetical protein MMPV_008196 [Pyropia vietnamensis]